MTDESKPPIKASKLWQKAQFLTIAESINLSLDYEPSNTREPPDGCNAVFKLLQESINDENNQLKFFKKIYKTPLKKQSSYLYAGISEQPVEPVEIDFFKSKITLNDFKVWLIEKDLKPSWLFDPDEETPANAPPMPTEKIKIPENQNIKERNNMLKLIYGMARHAYQYDPESNRNEATGNNKNSISSTISEYGINISDETIRKFLKEAKELL